MAANGKKQNAWTRKAYNELRVQFDREINTRLGLTSEGKDQANILAEIPAKKFDDVAKWLMKSANNSKDPAIERFVAAIAAFHLHNHAGVFTSDDLKRLIDLGYALLESSDIARYGSRLSYLYSEVDEAKARLYFDVGDSWAAVWTMLKSASQAKGEAKETILERICSTGRFARRRGYANLALDCFRTAIKDTEDERLEIEANIEAAVTERLLGRFDDCHSRLLKIDESFDLTGHERLMMQWQEYLILAAQGEPDRLIDSSSKLHRSYHYALEAALWAYACPSTKFLDKTLKAESIRKMLKPHSGPSRRDRLQDHLYDAIVQLETCYDKDIPMAQRFAAAEKLLDKLPRTPRIEHELLGAAAVARWYHRRQQPLLARVAMERYRVMSRTMTGGNSDAFSLDSGFNTNIGQHLHLASPSSAITVSTKQPLRFKPRHRLMDLTSVSLGVVGEIVRARFRRIGKTPDEIAKIRDEVALRIADRMLKDIGSMKGPMVKLSQMAVMSGYKLPIAIQQRFEQFFDDTQTLPGPVIRGVIEEAYGKKVEDVFSEWDDHAMAGASIGQVHRAKLLDGTNVAVKVRYPDIEKIIKADFKIVEALRPLLTALFPGIDIKGHIDANRDITLRECDYQNEAKNQQRIGKLLEHVPNLKIPKIFPELCNEDILVMEYVDCVPLQEFAMQGSVEARRRAAVTIFRAAFELYYKHGFYNADNHPGNYLIREDGFVHAIDFGMVDELTPDRFRVVSQFMGAMMANDMEQFAQWGREMGYGHVMSTDELKLKSFNLVKQIMAAPLEPGGYHVQRRETDAIEHVMGPQSKQRKNIRLQVGEFAMPRFALSIYSSLALLDVKADYYNEVFPHIAPNPELYKPVPFEEPRASEDAQDQADPSDEAAPALPIAK